MQWLCVLYHGRAKNDFGTMHPKERVSREGRRRTNGARYSQNYPERYPSKEIHLRSGRSRFSKPKFSRFASLATIDLSSYYREGNIPSEFGLWSKMTQLHWNDDYSNETILTKIGRLTTIRDLHNYGIMVSLPSEITYWQRLETLLVTDPKPLFGGMRPSTIGLGTSLQLFSGRGHSIEGEISFAVKFGCRI